MEQENLGRIKDQLEQRRKDLLTGIVASEAAVRDAITPSESGESPVDYNHPADMIEGDSDYEKDLRLLRRQRAELTLVDQALHRLTEGEYGHCEECGNDIPMARLEAIPFAKYCIACQEKIEAERADDAGLPRVHGEGGRNRQGPEAESIGL